MKEVRELSSSPRYSMNFFPIQLLIDDSMTWRERQRERDRERYREVKRERQREVPTLCLSQAFQSIGYENNPSL
jgi:hypothetical protein